MADGSWPLRETTARPIYAGAPGKLKVVGFAGGGGSSVAIKHALGVGPNMAMNHEVLFVLAHQRHFPQADHFTADIFEMDPRTYRPGEGIGLCWFSPDCTDFSKAKGSAPRSARIRGLAWSIIPWALWRRPTTIIVENVEEFERWGPVYRPGQALMDGRQGPARPGEPMAHRRGETFQRWVRRLRQLGYVVEWRRENSADYGMPTTRVRLYIICRYVGWERLCAIREGREPSPIIWDPPTHAPADRAAKLGLKPWVGGCEIIDFSLPCPSIFMTRAEAKAQKIKVNRPLVPATMARVAAGLDRWTLRARRPFVIPITNSTWSTGRSHDLGAPLPTIDAAKGGKFALSTATLASIAHGAGDGLRSWSPADALRTATSRNDKALISSFLVPRYGERPGQTPRSLSITQPYPTMVPTLNGGGLVAVTLHRQFGNSVGGAVDAPIGAIMAGGGGKTLLQTASLVRFFGSNLNGRDARQPVPTVMAEGGGGKIGVVAAYMAQGNFQRVGREAFSPITAITSRATQQQLIAANLVSYYRTGEGSAAGEPIRAATARMRHALTVGHMLQANTGMVGHPLTDPISTIVGLGSTQQLIHACLAREGGDIGRRAQVLEFLWTHFGRPTEAEWADPAGTLDARRKFGIVLLPQGMAGNDHVLTLEGLAAEPDHSGPCVQWMIVDIGLRMLTPRELAAAMGMPPEFDLETDVKGRPISKTKQTEMIGNMVCREPAATHIRSNCPELIQDPTERLAA